MKRRALILLSAILLSCAGMNPNPGERTADIAWEHKDYARALSIVRPAAERGEPWAQLRMGVAYELGVGLTKDTTESLKWYRRAALQTGEGGWAEGKLISGGGKAGYFNQNSDALIAQHQIANIYLRGDGVSKDLIEAYLWAKNVSEKTKGNSLFYCCETSGGRYISADAIAETLSKAEAEMTEGQNKAAREKFKSWKPY